MYHCPITIINIVRTKGKAGYRVWKLAGGQGDQDINLPCGSFEITFFFDFLETKLSVANPLLIHLNKTYLNKNVSERRLYYSVLFIWTEGVELFSGQNDELWQPMTVKNWNRLFNPPTNPPTKIWDRNKPKII